MTVLAYMPHLPRYVPYAWIFVVVVLFLIALIFIRVYVLGDWFRRRSAHRAGQHRSAHGTAHPVSHAPDRGGSHGHRAGARRPNRH